MTRYTADGVAMARYLVDRLPPVVDEVFGRAENGINVLKAPAVTVSEAVWAAAEKGTIAGVTVDTTPNAVLRGLVTDGSVRIAPADAQDLTVFESLVGHHTLHNALLVANHRVRGTDAILTNDEAFAGESTVWD
jgi:hypothetical protein